MSLPHCTSAIPSFVCSSKMDDLVGIGHKATTRLGSALGTATWGISRQLNPMNVSVVGPLLCRQEEMVVDVRWTNT